MLVGVISDTHGAILPGVHKAFKKVDRIVHAGDFDTPDVLAELEMIAPVVSVCGNMDSREWAHDIPKTLTLKLGGITALLVHNSSGVFIPPSVSLVISGHTHRPEWRKRNEKYYLNPGSARSPRGGGLPTVALLSIKDSNMDVNFVTVA